MRVLFLIFLFISNACKADDRFDEQTIQIKSLENKIVNLKLRFDNVNDKAEVSVLNNTASICLDGYRGLDGDLKILDEHFLEVTYAVRGGSDVKFRRTALICVSKGIAYVALNIESLSKGDITQVFDANADSLKLFDEHQLYEAKFSIEKKVLTARIRDYVKSKDDPATNKDISITYRAQFDSACKCFYTDKKRLNGPKDLYANDDKLKQINFDGSKAYPYIYFGAEPYYFINNGWYLVDVYDNFYPLSCH